MDGLAGGALGAGGHLTGVPDRVTSLLPFPPTWYNVLEPPRLRRRGTNPTDERTNERTGQKGRRRPVRAVGFETSSQSIESAPFSFVLTLSSRVLRVSLSLGPGHNRMLLQRVSYSWLMLQNHNRGKLLAWLFHASASVCGAHARKNFQDRPFPALPDGLFLDPFSFSRGATRCSFHAGNSDQVPLPPPPPPGQTLLSVTNRPRFSTG